MADLGIETKDSRGRWQSRLERARELRDQQPAVSEAMRLYVAALEFQCDVAARSTQRIRPTTPLREQIDPAAACAALPAMLAVAESHGPERLREEARQLRQAREGKWRQMIDAALASGVSTLHGVDDFFARSCLQPLAENLQVQMPADAHYIGKKCPACGGLPQMAVLRPEGEGASRSLVCSFCLREWMFRRVICPWCGEEDKEKLPRFSSADGEQSDYVHVEACDTCMRYMKAVDLSKNGLAVPLVDEAAWAVLDVWATGRGYQKIVPNLMGF